MNYDEIRLYLPKYLSNESKNLLKEALRDFPNITSKEYYSSQMLVSEFVFQGDVIKNLVIVDLPNTEIKKTDCIVLSNTCDISKDNKRLFDSRLVYSPLIRLKTYESFLLQETNNPSRVSDHIRSIRQQEITQILFLPEYENKKEESIVFLDRLLNLPSNYLNPEDLPQLRISSLSQAGHYLLLFKLSFHFSRIQEGIDRNHPNI